VVVREAREVGIDDVGVVDGDDVCADVVGGDVVVCGGDVVVGDGVVVVGPSVNVVVSAGVDVVVGAGVVGFGVVVVGGILQSAACRVHPEHESHCESTRRWAATQASLLPLNSCSEENWMRFLHGETTSSKSQGLSQPPGVVVVVVDAALACAFAAFAVASFLHQAFFRADQAVARLAYPAVQLYDAVEFDVSVEFVSFAIQ